MPVSDPSHVVVVLPTDRPADRDAVAEFLAPHVCSRYAPFPIYPVRGRGPVSLVRRRSREGLLDVVRRDNGTLLAAGGALSRLDLPRLAQVAADAARTRWQAWKTHVATGTPRAREWESFHPQHQRSTRVLAPAEARQRFEAQPRVLTMLAVNAHRVLPFRLDPYELAAFQAGEHVYCTLAAQQAVVGQVLVVPGGFAYRPVTASIADRLRYLRAALDVVHALPADRHLAAATTTT